MSPLLCSAFIDGKSLVIFGEYPQKCARIYRLKLSIAVFEGGFPYQGFLEILSCTIVVDIFGIWARNFMIK